MSRTISRNAELEEEERCNEKANGGNDPTLAFFSQRVNFKCEAMLFDVKPHGYRICFACRLCLQKEFRVYTIKKTFSKYSVFINR